MKNILIICSKYSASAEDAYLTNDLVNEMAANNYDVTVLSYSNENIRRKHGNKEEHLIKISSSIKILKYVFLWLKLFLNMVSIIIKRRKYDQVIVIATLSVKWPSVILLPFIKARKKTYIIFDIYPVHQIKIGSLPTIIEWPLWLIEYCLVKNFNSILTMGERNKEYISKYYKINQQKILIDSINLWGAHNKPISPKPINYPNISFVFGGQIIKGRRLDRAISFLKLIRKRGINITLDIYSDDLRFDVLKKLVSENEWINFNTAVTRSEYMKTISKYDVGLIVTDESADLPTFPSKIIDYAAAGLVAFCIVEKESELYSCVGNSKRVYINSFDFSENGIISAIDFLRKANENIDSEAKKLNKFFSINDAVDLISK